MFQYQLSIPYDEHQRVIKPGLFEWVRVGERDRYIQESAEEHGPFVCYQQKWANRYLAADQRNLLCSQKQFDIQERPDYVQAGHRCSPCHFLEEIGERWSIRHRRGSCFEILNSMLNHFLQSFGCDLNRPYRLDRNPNTR